MEPKFKNDANPYFHEQELAGISQRFLANLLDGLILMIPFIIISIAIATPENTGVLNAFAFGVSLLYNWYFWTRHDGQTPGKSALGIRVVRTDGKPLTDVDALIRVVGYQVSSLIMGLGYLWAIFDGKNQAWHDKLARTYVVRTESRRKTVEIPN